MDSVCFLPVLGGRDQHLCEAALQDEQHASPPGQRNRYDADGQHYRYCHITVFFVSSSLVVFDILC
jgi:hypothetical protein